MKLLLISNNATSSRSNLFPGFLFFPLLGAGRGETLFWSHDILNMVYDWLKTVPNASLALTECSKMKQLIFRTNYYSTVIFFSVRPSYREVVWPS